MIASTLEDRVASAFAADARSSDVSILIDEAETAANAADARAEQARALALDPALPPAEVTVARKQMDDCTFASARLNAALPRLRDRLKQLRNREEDARRQVAYEKAMHERDQLAEELARVYPALAKQIVDLASRLAANDRVLDLINNHARPRDGEFLRSAEEVARGVVGFGSLGTGIPRITKDLRLPAFSHSTAAPYAWPPRPERPVDYALAAGSLQADKARASTERQTEEEAVARAEV